jgi:hypothetical protein
MHNVVQFFHVAYYLCHLDRGEEIWSWFDALNILRMQNYQSLLSISELKYMSFAARSISSLFVIHP